eukprot:evm.model.scf_1678.1 EVM.evm.TU.scf_1678.1   scf_1678:12851-19332(-)
MILMAVFSILSMGLTWYLRIERAHPQNLDPLNPSSPPEPRLQDQPVPTCGEELPIDCASPTVAHESPPKEDTVQEPDGDDSPTNWAEIQPDPGPSHRVIRSPPQRHVAESSNGLRPRRSCSPPTEMQPGSVTQWTIAGSSSDTLENRIMEDYCGSPCTKAILFCTQVGDIWEGGKQKRRVMGLAALKGILHKMKGRGERSNIENAFKVEKRGAEGVEIHYSSTVRATEVREVGNAAAVGMEFVDEGENYIFSAKPKEWHTFANRKKAEAMFKWAVKNAKSGPNKGELRRDMFLVVEVLVASRVVFVKTKTAGKVNITAPLAGGAGSTEVFDRLSELRLAQVRGDIMVRNVTPSVEAHKVVNNSDCACIVRVKNNATWKSSRDFERSRGPLIRGFRRMWSSGTLFGTRALTLTRCGGRGENLMDGGRR